MQSSKEIEEVAARFVSDKAVSVCALDGGHINYTYLVDTTEGRFVLQRLQRKMDLIKLEHNYILYSAACERHGFMYPKWIKSRDGSFFYTDQNGDSWRMYGYINASILNVPLSEKDLYVCGQGLSEMHAVLRELPQRPMAVFPHLHDLQYYYEEYVRLKNGDDLCDGNRDPDMESIIEAKIERMLAVQPKKLSVIHGDPKLSNILFREGSVIGFLDLDTVMVGSLAEDVADCIRSCCAVNGRFSISSAMRFLDGYRSMAPSEAADDIIDRLPETFNKINFELGLRYYSDAISKEKRFRENDPIIQLQKARIRLKTSWD